MVSDEKFESLQRVSTFLTRPQVEFLDDLSRQMKFSGGYKLPRTKIIRATLSVFMELGIDVSGVKSEKELEERIRNGVKRKRQGGQKCEIAGI
ncbi:MAG: hypothetical protein AB1466_07355 [Actinomycetota bacterium]